MTNDVDTTAEERTGGRHPLHVGHLVMGLAFVGVVVIWLLGAVANVSGDDLQWLVPVPFLLAGGLGVLALLLSGRRRTT